MISNWQCIWRGEGGGVAPERERKKGGNITSNVQCCLYIYGAGRNEFDAGKSISRAVGKGRSLKIETFLSPENGNERSECHVGPKTVYCLTYYISRSPGSFRNSLLSLSNRVLHGLRFKPQRTTIRATLRPIWAALYTFCIFFSGLECVGHSFAFAAHFLWFWRISVFEFRTQRACREKQTPYQLAFLLLFSIITLFRCYEC